jgi:hypothetical protein
VLRAYDNRATYTERRSDVYLNWSKLKATTRVVFDTAAAAAVSFGEDADASGKGFGTILPGSDVPTWMWKEDKPAFESRLLVISTPFLKGRHYATSPGDFLPLVDQLQELHEEGYVHGDIRGFNTAFAEDGGYSQFFDWDLGGKAEQVKYPRYYNASLIDGERLDRKGQVIRKLDDWCALTNLALVKHLGWPSTLRDLLRFPHSETGDDNEKHVAKLKKFLQDAEANSWTVEPTPLYSAEAKKVDNMQKATGSPPKDIKHGGKQETHRS